MRRSLLAAALTAVLALPAANARAVTVPTAGLDASFSVTVTGVLIGLFLPAIQAEREASIKGGVTLDLNEIARRSNNFSNGGRADVLFSDILDFDLTINLPTDAADGSADVRLTPQTGAIEVVNTGWFTDGTNLIIDSSGQPPGTAVLQFTVDKFDDAIAFPNGRRVGDDVNDIILAQLFTGSVNLGVAALPGGFLANDPAFIGAAQLTPDNEFVFGTLDNDVSAVPLPASAPLLAGGVGVFWALRRRRPSR